MISAIRDSVKLLGKIIWPKSKERELGAFERSRLDSQTELNASGQSSPKVGVGTKRIVLLLNFALSSFLISFGKIILSKS